MRRRAKTLLLAGAASLVGCSSLLLPTTPQPVYYQLDYAPPSVACPHGFGKGVRVWDFSAESPFERPELVVTEGRKTSYSRSFQWVASPGALVAQSLIRDLEGGPLFSSVEGAQNPGPSGLELTGRIFQFAWVREGDNSRAVLDLEVSLARTGAKPGVVFQRRYTLRSTPSPAGDDSAAFARAMSGLVRELSEKLQTDLCATAGPG